MDTNKMREQFEAAFVERQVGAFGEGYRSTAQHMLKREGDFDEPPTAYKLHCRNRGMYDTYWVEMAWWAWQASREAVVVELPQPFVGDDFTMYDGKEIIEAIEAQGLKVEVKP